MLPPSSRWLPRPRLRRRRSRRSPRGSARRRSTTIRPPRSLPPRSPPSRGRSTRPATRNAPYAWRSSPRRRRTRRARLRRAGCAPAQAQGTVVVALPKSTQIASLNVGGRRLAQAQAAVASTGGYAGARAAVEALTAPLAPPTRRPPPARPGRESSSPDSSGGISSWIWILIAVIVIALAAVLIALRIRTRRVRRRGGGNLIEGARALLQGRLDGLGEVLAETAVGVSEREDLALTSHHRSASETVSEVRASIGRLDGPPAFRAAHGRLDDAEWHLGVVQAHLAQGGEPPRPESGHPATLLLQRRARARNRRDRARAPGRAHRVRGHLRRRRRPPLARRGARGRSRHRRAPQAALGRCADVVRRLGLGSGRSPLAALPRSADLRLHGPAGCVLRRHDDGGRVARAPDSRDGRA